MNGEVIYRTKPYPALLVLLEVGLSFETVYRVVAELNEDGVWESPYRRTLWREGRNGDIEVEREA